MNYRYTLDKSSKKFHCPSCSNKRFVLYIDEVAKEYAPPQYGICDRKSSCGYRLAPPAEKLSYFVAIDSIKEITDKAFVVRQNDNEMLLPKSVVLEQMPNGIYIAAYFIDEPKYNFNLQYNESNQKYFSDSGSTIVLEPIKLKPKFIEPIYFDFETFRKTLKSYEQNTFIQNLLKRVQFPFSTDEVTKVVVQYRLGTVTKGYRAGAITFPYIDKADNVRAVQVKQFNEQNNTSATDKLDKIILNGLKNDNKNIPNWLSSYIDYGTDNGYFNCLFGEHLLNRFPLNPIALVEAPKTAIYGTLYFGSPDIPNNLIWLAVYNESSFNFDKLKVLEGRDIFVFPDLSKDGSTFKRWQEKAKDYETRLPATRFIFSDLLEKLADDHQRQQGADLADVLIRLNAKDFRKDEVKSYEQFTYIERILTGLRLFDVQELAEMAAQMFLDREKMSYRDIIDYFKSDGLNGTDATDLLDVLVIQKVVIAIDYPNYKLIKVK
ncbi:DUF6371 domain-containing protein [Chryseobacterium potabilaquae]|uniref:Uncharacterized protein n=1 Tax=Chryseobacterium potabilaquae TaxID=2675057 RepID=A0A6N4X4Q3_9FLAO|nr:DUF6371 domain-containing protein [Chryseobacterium potabilaquae]CAA7195875.1 hypothetical protein CHRY9293_02032 [Chryseobacterium potabilaquae]